MSSTPQTAVLGALAILTLAACQPTAVAQTAAAPPPPEVTVAQPVVRPVEAWSEHTGRFRPVNSVEVRPRVSGYLQRAHFTDGQIVRAGQLLFTIDPLPYQAESDRSRAEVSQADARLALARSEYARAERLRALDAISEEEFDTRRQAVSQAGASRQAAQAALRSDALQVGYTRVYAPISGRISDRRVDAGNLVAAGETVLTRIDSLNPIHFEFSAPEGLLAGEGGPALSRGVAKTVSLQLEGQTDYALQGRLDFLDTQVDGGTGTIRGRAVVANPGGRLTPGQFARLRVLTPASGPSVLLPDSAINTDQSRKYVLVVNARNLAEYRPVTLGPAADGLRVIRTGLTGAERVIINGLQRAMPGQPVKPKAGRIVAQASDGAQTLAVQPATAG